MRGEESTERSCWKWISASHTASKPSRSAARTSTIESSNAVAGSVPGNSGNSVKKPISTLPVYSPLVAPVALHGVVPQQRPALGLRESRPLEEAVDRLREPALRVREVGREHQGAVAD